MKKNIFIFFSYLIICLYLISLPFTHAKFYFSSYGIAWENYFTAFSQLKEVFVIKDENGIEEKELWGAIVSSNNNGISIGNGSISYNEDLDQYTFGSMGSYDNRIEHEEIEEKFGDYFIDNLKGIEFNAVNQTSESMVAVFEIYYYAPKIQNDTDTHITCGIYNTILKSSADFGIKCEFIVDKGSSNYSTGRYEHIDIPAIRTSGADKGEANVDGSSILGLGGKIYYPHRAEIHPYKILYNSGKDIPTGHYIDATSTPSTYIYPAHDNTSKKDATDLLTTDINDFIISPGESASFNLSLYYGDYGSDSQQTNYSFVTDIKFLASPLSEVISEKDSILSNF